MKKILLVSAATLIGAPALAADLPRRSAAPAPAPIFVQAFSWEGFYVGAQVGYGWGKNSTRVYNAPGQLMGAFTAKPKGFLGGVHAGYNMQSGSMVYGVEADLEHSWVKSRRVFMGTTFNGKTGFQGSLRGRLGVAFDRTLLYVTGGLAVANVKTSGFIVPDSFRGSDTRFGWTVGAGAQYAFNNNWSARLEYRYTDLGKEDFSLGTVLPPPGFARSSLKEHSVRVGVSYRFAAPARPIVARY